jgi:hypothetical protein
VVYRCSQAAFITGVTLPLESGLFTSNFVPPSPAKSLDRVVFAGRPDTETRIPAIGTKVATGEIMRFYYFELRV